MSETVTVKNISEMDVTVYCVSIGPKDVDFTLTTDKDNDLVIDIEPGDAIEALKAIYNTEDLLEMIRN